MLRSFEDNSRIYFLGKAIGWEWSGRGHDVMVSVHSDEHTTNDNEDYYFGTQVRSLEIFTCDYASVLLVKLLLSKRLLAVIR